MEYSPWYQLPSMANRQWSMVMECVLWTIVLLTAKIGQWKMYSPWYRPPIMVNEKCTMDYSPWN